MSHIDTLAIYESYRATGLDDKSAREYTNILENSFMTKVNELKDDFVSNKLVAIIGSIIIALGGFTLNKVWDLSHDMTDIKSRLSSVEARLGKVEDKIK